MELECRNNDKFVDYYADQSISPAAYQRFEAIRNIVFRMLNADELGVPEHLDVADIGCNAGTQCIMWAKEGHRVHGVDVNEQLLEIAAERTREAGVEVEYVLGSAVDLPWKDDSVDVCLVPELLEHVADWRSCLNECCRILRRGGVLYLSTTNYLCPKQQEFSLPLYSWYPSALKNRYERLAMSTRPELANHARFPAVNWFTYYSLRDELLTKGVRSFDRFDVIDEASKGALTAGIVRSIRALPLLRLLGHICTPYTVVIGVKS